jgi:hypothetical protein
MQYERWGLLFFLAYPASSFAQLLRGRNPYWYNYFEIEARERCARLDGPLSQPPASARSARPMSDPNWLRLMTVHDTLSAQALADRLKSEGVPARVETDSSLLGTARRCDILVPAELLHRAEAMISSGQFTDEELASLATPGDGHDRG